jgi:hypothetical protein
VAGEQQVDEGKLDWDAQHGMGKAPRHSPRRAKASQAPRSGELPRRVVADIASDATLQSRMPAFTQALQV